MFAVVAVGLFRLVVVSPQRSSVGIVDYSVGVFPVFHCGV